MVVVNVFVEWVRALRALAGRLVRLGDRWAVTCETGATDCVERGPLARSENAARIAAVVNGWALDRAGYHCPGCVPRERRVRLECATDGCGRLAPPARTLLQSGDLGVRVERWELVQIPKPQGATWRYYYCAACVGRRAGSGAA